MSTQDRGLKLRKCDNCDQYTLEQKCPQCGFETRSAHPARFSPEDKDSADRIAIKERWNQLPYQKEDIKM